ncbi:MAG TPA: hypothetical protein VMZ26_00815 [Pyrinomonadaceae bacterium]|nr:hypothetical protein [Pyrinomonadaceae bacterium]
MSFANKRLIGIIVAVAILLLIPLVAGAPWSRLDFVLAAVLLLGTGFLIELALRVVKKLEYRVALCAAILAALALIWIELAVGIFGTPFAGS